MKAIIAVVLFVLVLAINTTLWLICFGYDEGTFHNVIIGEISNAVFLILNFPMLLLKLFSSYNLEGFMLLFVFDSVLWSILIYFLLLNFINKLVGKSKK